MKCWKSDLLIITMLSFVGCSIFRSGDTERTYPEALDLEILTIRQLLNEVQTPDSVNIDPYVIDVHECPEGATCIIPDQLDVSERLPPSNTLQIPTENPDQFEIMQQYIISLEVTNPDSNEQKDLRILGYTKL